ncbi:hypothetical protein OESDEN_04590 [Oesophagostomum dentatum]|uniref:Uncharacterized protein n=1 Tax=Oesophagostomum dentatum TaxID=61180 RepID=A0A0B1TH72_OESDE|nr:hypothetical protein OESDEN_04590 [Oesophagostomum dentatum]
MKTIWEDQRDTQRIESLGDLQFMEKRLSLAPTPPKNYNKVIAHSPPLEKPDLTKVYNFLPFSETIKLVVFY